MAASIFADFGQNSGFVEELYRLYLVDPSLVDSQWREYFGSLMRQAEGAIPPLDNGNGHHSPERNGTAAASIHLHRAGSDLMDLQQRVTELVHAYRERGHFRAKTNPLTHGTAALPEAPDLSPSYWKIQSEDLDRSVQSSEFRGQASMRLGDLLAGLEQTYCGSIGFEFMHLTESEERGWWRSSIERQGSPQSQFSPEHCKRFFQKLHEAEHLEAELHKKFVGAKRFSLQGGDVLMPMLDVLVDLSARSHCHEVVIGMAHRGRLNVLVNTCGKPLADLFSEFEDSSTSSVLGSGDVKYHQGWRAPVQSFGGQEIYVSLAPNPSHLEFINPVVQGMVRALQDINDERPAVSVLPILIHGDAAFIGQGVVAETLGFSGTKPYGTAGTVHIIINNQVGFTTSAFESRSSAYSSDIAKSIGAPIIHVNGEDVEACCYVTKLAFEYRAKFKKDVVIDFLCYRKYGHNEGDDPTFTQPLMYQEVKNKRPLEHLYAQQLLDRGVINAEERAAIEQIFTDRFAEANQQRGLQKVGEACPAFGHIRDKSILTAIDQGRLQDIARTIVQFPDGFSAHQKLKAILEKRAATVQDGHGIDWGLSETLAFASLIEENINVRISGQDVGRGTFSHRHLELHDVENGGRWYPLNEFAQKKSVKARCQVYNSTLSETAVMGFEFGYSCTRPDALVLWEAQFGDFANGAQVIIDQFLAASEVKWGQCSGLVLLLPHGYEGQGPEHSSARLERFLQLCAQGNMTVCYPTSGAQYFHLLRRQGLATVKRPLVVMSPKSLLRSPDASSELSEFTSGGFEEVRVTKFQGKAAKKDPTLLLCSGKIFYDIKKAVEQAGASAVVARMEQLYPLPEPGLKDLLKERRTGPVWWIQEEPQNMGAWTYMADQLRRLGVNDLRFIGRPPSASTACGSARWHAREHKNIIDELGAALQ